MALVFIHVPKTAGTTFKQILLRNYGKNVSLDTLFPYRSISSLQYYLESNRTLEKELLETQFELIYGHHALPHAQYPQHAFITFLRDPVDRIISEYDSVVPTPWHVNAKIINDENITLSDYPVRFPFTGSNLMVKTYASLEEIKPGEEKKALEMAKRNIETRFDAIGITEHFDLSLILFKHKKILKDLRYRDLNKSKSVHEVRQSDLDTIENANKLDRELYQFALRLFEHNIDAIPSDYKQRHLKRLKVSNLLSPENIAYKAYKFLKPKIKS